MEDWAPNIPIATRRLAPLGVTVASRRRGPLPVDASSVGLVLNRHGDLDLPETARVLMPGGSVIAQQVTSDNESELNESFGVAPATFANTVIDVSHLVRRAGAAGLVVDVAAYAVTVARYRDVGAVVLQLRAVPWQVPGFSTDRHRHVLQDLHEDIQRSGSFAVHSRRALLLAHRPNP